MKKRAFIYSAILLLSGAIINFPVNANDAKGLERLQQAPKFQQENKVAVIVGINAYDRSTGLRPLRYAAADANNLRNTLIKQGYKVRLLTNQQAGKYRILDAIEQAGKTLRKGTGTFLFAYSGHGFASRNRNYLASHGTVLSKLAQSALPLSEVQQAIRKTGAKRAMLFIDACRNDPNIAGSKAVGNVGFIYTKSQGMKTLYATKFGEVSWESPQLRHGVFSHFLIKALRGEAADANGIISFGTVENYVQKNVSSWTFDHKMPNTQLPFSNGNSFGVLVLGQKAGSKPISPSGSGANGTGNNNQKAQREERYWADTKKCNQAVCYQNYLTRYPQGKYAPLARQKIQVAKQPKPPSALVYRPQPPHRQQSFEPEMRLIRSGRFQMGSPANEKNHDSDEKQHSVQVGNFWIAKTETTFKQWQACVDGGGCQSNKKPKDYGWGRGNRPVVDVSWHDANDYARWLSKQTGKDYHLPTEAQWEFAARGGTSTAFSFGNRISTAQANFDGNYTYNGSAKGRFLQKTAPVGSYPANRYGLQDMHGNVYEWTCSAYDKNYGGSEKQCAKRNETRSRVLRGGSWGLPRYVRSANRSLNTPSTRYFDVGFRLSRTN